MATDCRKLVDAYLAWLRDKTSVQEINGVCEITTPFLDRHNDRLQIYVRQKNGTMVLTDDGFILSDLELSGCAVDTPHRSEILQTILNGYGVRSDDDELVVEATMDNFAQKKHALLQAMMAVNDMFMTARPRVASLFLEDVANFLETNDVRFSPDVEFTGRSGFVHKFDFLIPKSRKKPERILKAINHPRRDAATSLIFAWNDTREVRPANALAYAILNDSEGEPSSDVMSALHHYQINTVPWSGRSQYVQEFAA